VPPHPCAAYESGARHRRRRSRCRCRSAPPARHAPRAAAARRRRRGPGIIAISREALLNDDIGLIGGVIDSLANAAASCESDIAYSALFDNPTMGDGFALFSTQRQKLPPAARLTAASPSAATPPLPPP